MSAVTSSRVGRVSSWQKAGRQGSVHAGVGLALRRRGAAMQLHDARGMASIVTVRSRTATR